MRKKRLADPSIGQHPQLDENGRFDPDNITWVKDGEIIAPKPQDELHQVFTGGALDLEVSEAQDWDGWLLDGLGSGVEKDSSLTYRWTAGEGHFAAMDAEGKPTESSSASGRKVQWVAPTQLDTGETTVEIKCTIDDAAGNRVGEFEAGTRNDDLLERTVSVKVTKAPSLVIQDFTLKPGVTVGVPTEVKLTAEIEGVTPDNGEVTWLWFTPQVKFRQEEPMSPEDWKNATSGNANVPIEHKYSKTSTQPWEFQSEGYYQVKVIATANFKVNGVHMTLISSASNQDN